MIVTPPVIHKNDSGWYLTGFLQGKVPVDMLLDTGATYSLLPASIYDDIPSDLRPSLKPEPRCRLVGFTGEKANVRGSTTMTFGTPKNNWDVRFLVVEKCTTGILGVDFLEEHGIRMDYAQGLIWFNQTYTPIHKIAEKETAAMIRESHDLRPRTEGVVEAFIDCFPPNSVVLVEGTMEDLERGFVLANSMVTVGEGGKCLLRIMNPGMDTLTIQPCQVGKVSLVSKVSIAHPLV